MTDLPPPLQTPDRGLRCPWCGTEFIARLMINDPGQAPPTAGVLAACAHCQGVSIHAGEPGGLYLLRYEPDPEDLA